MTLATTVQAPPHQTSPSAERCDVLVIGGGPAGSTAATLLAQRGFAVTLLEKAHHPRFHIGESLLPANMPLFDELGVRAEIEAMGMPKWGVEFNSPWHEHTSSYEFGDAWDKSMPYAFQVRRDNFDHILIRNAAAKGATVIEGCRVRGVEFMSEGAVVQAEHDDGRKQSWQVQYVLDASGRDTFITNKLGTKIKNKKHNSAALYGHFTGATRLLGKREGDISLFWFEHGWFWFIPLADGTTSVGAVCWPYYMASRKKPLKEFFEDTIAMAPKLAERLQGATLVGEEVHPTGNYAYGNRVSYGDRFLLLGDAYAFIDPVFSSGVLLAMKSAFAGVEAVTMAIREPAKKAAAFKAFDKQMRVGPKEFSWFIYRVTNPMMRDLFMGPRNILRAKEALLSVLAGDIFSNRAIWPSVYVFKAIYYIGSLLNFKRTRQAIKRRQVNIQDVQAT